MKLTILHLNARRDANRTLEVTRSERKGYEVNGRSRQAEQADEDEIVHRDVQAQPAVIAGSSGSKDR